MGPNQLINGVYWGYNPLTNLLLTSWDIQVDFVYISSSSWNFFDLVTIPPGVGLETFEKVNRVTTRLRDHRFLHVEQLRDVFQEEFGTNGWVLPMKDLEMFVGKLGIDPQDTTRIFPIFMPRSHPRWEGGSSIKKPGFFEAFWYLYYVPNFEIHRFTIFWERPESDTKKLVGWILNTNLTCVHVVLSKRTVSMTSPWPAHHWPSSPVKITSFDVRDEGLQHNLGGGFKTFLIFTPTWEMIQFD